MLKHCIDYIVRHAELNATILKQLIENLSPIYTLHSCIEFHLNKRLPHQRSYTLFSWFGTSRAEEIAVTRKFLNKIETSTDDFPNLGDFNEREQKILLSGKLEEIIRGVDLLIETRANLEERSTEPLFFELEGPLLVEVGTSPRALNCDNSGHISPITLPQL